MTTFSGARAAIRARLEAEGSGITIPLKFQNEQVVLPDVAAAFAYVEIENFGAGRGPAEYGGGPGRNNYRNEGVITAYTFAPNDEGAEVAEVAAETIAARLRSFRSSDISCFSAVVKPVGSGTSISPPGLNSEVGNYWCAVAEIAFHFDQIG